MSEFENSGKWSWEIQKEQQAKIDYLKTLLNNMERCYIQMKKINDEQSEIIQGHIAARTVLQKQVDKALSVCNENRLCIGKFMIEDETLELISDMEEVLRGGDQNTKNKAQSTENIGHEGGDQKAMIEAQEQNR